MVNGYRRTSGRVRFHHYTRAALYSFWVAETGSIVVWTLAAPSEAALWVRLLILLLGGIHVWLMAWLTRDGLRSYLHGAPRPDRLLAAGFLVTLAATAMALVLIGTGYTSEKAAVVVVWFPVFFVGPTLLVLPIPRGTVLAAVPVALMSVTLPLLDIPLRSAQALVVSALLTSALFGATFRSSAWTLRVVDELDAGRETQARLAVAEERLRFGRDMHDVLGRNLSVMALKSELAVQLAQRGSPAAVDQMAEVQRIARESQREMRAVLRGYREADLQTEIAGARGVLEAAGISCAVAAQRAGQLSAEVCTPLGWVVREAATNVLRHSDARHCELRLEVDDTGAAVLTVRNDGVPEHPPAGHPGSGLAGLRERLATVGGTLRAEPGDGGRFVLTARVPTVPTDPTVPATERSLPAQARAVQAKAAEGKAAEARAGATEGGGGRDGAGR
jgi:two-component system sensor histidine kinase DesK